MTQPTHFTLTKVFLCAFAGAALSTAIGLVLYFALSSPPPPQQVAGLNVDELGTRRYPEGPEPRRLDLEGPSDPQSIEDRHPSLATPSQRITALAPSGGAVDVALDQRLSAIERALASLEANIKTARAFDPPAPAALLRSVRVARDWEALNVLCSQYEADPIGAADSVRVLTYEEVLIRFGQPTSITKDNYWYYRRNAGDTRKPGWVRFIFISGVVSDVQVGND